jgi:hypothetical protein
MTKDNSYAFSTFAAIGGIDYEGENFRSMRLFGSADDAIDYARVLLNEGSDYAYVTGVKADGSLELRDAMRIADDGPDSVNLDY